MPPTFRNTQIVDKTNWNNFHGTIAHQHVPLYSIVDPIVSTAGGATASGVRRHDGLQDILNYCFTQNPVEPLRTVGATWSLSSIIQPKNVILDPAVFDGINRVDATQLTPAYLASVTASGNVPMVVMGGTQIARLNQKLGEVGLALPTSGANDGHRFAGCIATATHGSAISYGAVHDAVRGVFLVVSPTEAVFVQPKSNPYFKDGLRQFLEASSGFKTRDVQDDDAFFAAMVSLGSLGFVHSVVIETVPLYQLKQRIIQRPLGDAQVLQALRTLDTSALHPDIPAKPWHFAVIVAPYASAGSPGFFVSLMWKVSAAGVPFAGPNTASPMVPSDTGALVAKLAGLLGGPVTGPILEHVISSQAASLYPPGDIAAQFPGQVFGQTTLPPGIGSSAEIVVNQADSVNALTAIFAGLNAEKANGRYLLGALGVRSVPQTNALLGMNIHPNNCYIEIPGLRNAEIPLVHKACWDALDKAKVPYICHWGQLNNLDAGRINTYYGPRVARWKAARAALLTAPNALDVFAAPLLGSVGLHP